jgi:hypothetical protein
MYDYTQYGDKNYDQHFLHQYIYPNVKDISLIHASFNKYENNCKEFPISYCYQYKFVGEYVYEDESRSQIHIDALKKELQH